MQTNTVAVGADDGHDTIKTCVGYDAKLGQYECYSMKSIALSGLHQIVSLGETNCAYKTGEDQFTVAGENALGDYLDTRFLDYPKSSLNRVLVQHALHISGMGGKNVALVTGLPVDQYYQNGQENEALCKAKTANLLLPVINLNKSIVPAVVVSNTVISEGIAAIYDVVLDHDGSENEEMATLVARKPIAVVDMGGKTLDIATISENVRGVYAERSGTFEVGVIKLKEKIAAAIKSKFNLNNLPPSKYIEEALRTKKYEIFGNYEDVTEIIESSCDDYVDQIKNAFLKKVGDGSDLGAVIFVGGGAALLQCVFGKDIFSKVYRGKKIIPAQPEFSNARGMWKAAKYLFEIDEQAGASI